MRHCRLHVLPLHPFFLLASSSSRSGPFRPLHDAACPPFLSVSCRRGERRSRSDRRVSQSRRRWTRLCALIKYYARLTECRARKRRDFCLPSLLIAKDTLHSMSHLYLPKHLFVLYRFCVSVYLCNNSVNCYIMFIKFYIHI